MGKRELLLIAGFIVFGALVYQFTAPAPRPGEREFSIGRIIDHLRREVRGNRASAQVSSTSLHAADGVDEVRFRLRTGDITIIGEERADLQADLVVTSNGVDQAEAERLARATSLKLDRAGALLDVSIAAPQQGVQRPSLVMRLPSRMRVRLEPSNGKLKIENVAEVEVANARGPAEIRGVSGRVVASHAVGGLVISSVGRLKLTTRSSDAVVERVAQEATFSLRAGELKARGIGGAIDLDSNNTEVTLDAADVKTGPVRAVAVNGKLAITGLHVDSRIEGRNAEIDVVADRAAPLAIYSDGDEPVEFTPPPSGYQIDAVASNGRITFTGDDVPVTSSGSEQRAAGKVRGGGAAITIRSSRGDIKIRSKG